MREAATTALCAVTASAGDLRNADGSLTARLEYDGELRGASGRRIGTMRDARRNWAAVYVFFL